MAGADGFVKALGTDLLPAIVASFVESDGPARALLLRRGQVAISATPPIRPLRHSRDPVQA